MKFEGAKILYIFNTYKKLVIKFAYAIIYKINTLPTAFYCNVIILYSIINTILSIIYKVLLNCHILTINCNLKNKSFSIFTKLL